jgi:transcription elongation factor GreA
MNSPIYVTKDGLEKLKSDLKELKEVKVPEVAKRIQVARDNGDISENAEYDAAKHEQAVIEGKIKELEDIIKNSKVSENKSTGAVVVGSKVILHLEGQKIEFHIVGAMEADPANRKISHESPIGAALLGKKIGEAIEVQAPIGTLTYKILEIN